MTKRRCRCRTWFMPRTANHLCCAACSAAHRAGKRCESLVPCKTCDNAFARLAAYNHRRKHEGADRDRRRGIDILCPCGCGASYAGFRSGFSFTDARRDFITEEPDRRTGRRRHGRRNQVLGKAREWKKLAWSTMVDLHLTAKGH